MTQYRVQKHRSKKLATAINACKPYIQQGVPAWVLPYKGDCVVCFGVYKDKASAVKFKETLKTKYGITHCQIVQED